MLVKFFKNYGYFKAGKTYDIEPCHADYLLMNTYSCYNAEPFDDLVDTVVGAISKLRRNLRPFPQNPQTHKDLGKEIL